MTLRFAVQHHETRSPRPALAASRLVEQLDSTANAEERVNNRPKPNSAKPTPP